MAMNLVIRPLSVQQRKISPRITRPIIKPQQAVTKTLRAVIQAKSPIRSPSRNVRQVTKRVSSVVIPKRGAVARPASKSHKPTVKIVTRDPPESSTKKLRELHNSCVGKTLAIIANGPSVLEIDTTKLISSKIDIMSINRPDLRVWPTKYWLFCDISQLKRHNSLWKDYNGYTFNSVMINESRPGTIFIKNIPGLGFSLDLTKGFNIGRSSVYAAMQVALWLGYDKIYIFGIDMGAITIEGKEILYFYGVNLDCASDNRKKRFAEEAKYYDDAANSLPSEIREKFYFCSTYNKFRFIDKFNRLDHHKAIEMLYNIGR
jgi:hypothetical protein